MVTIVPYISMVFARGNPKNEKENKLYVPIADKLNLYHFVSFLNGICHVSSLMKLFLLYAVEFEDFPDFFCIFGGRSLMDLFLCVWFLEDSLRHV